MKTIIQISKRDNLPILEYLISAMWKPKIEFSFVKDSAELKACKILCLSWDKWIDDLRWKHNNKFKEYIYFKIDRRKVEIEIDNGALFVDLRAYYLAVYTIYNTAGLKIFEESGEIVPIKDFSERYAEYLHCSFEEAVERSLENK